MEALLTLDDAMTGEERALRNTEIGKRNYTKYETERKNRKRIEARQFRLRTLCALLMVLPPALGLGTRGLNAICNDRGTQGYVWKQQALKYVGAQKSGGMSEGLDS